MTYTYNDPDSSILNDDGFVTITNDYSVSLDSSANTSYTDIPSNRVTERYTEEELEILNRGLSPDHPQYTNQSYTIQRSSVVEYDWLPYDFDPSGNIQDILDDIGGPLLDKIQELRSCVGERFQLNKGVETYDEFNINKNAAGDLNPQFANCPDKTFYYSSGWDYKDGRQGEFTGAVPGGVRWFRGASVGVPLKTSTTESHNPGRIANLPNAASTMIHNEPVKIVWVHPFLERGDIGFKGKFPGESFDGTGWPEWAPDPETERDVQNLAFSYYTEEWTWQSGPVSNSPTNSEVELKSGFWTNAGGLNSKSADEETKLTMNREFYDYGKTNFRIGYSRGNDTILYGDSPTEGLEYGVVGVSGYVSSLPNESWPNTKYNAGIQHMYTINRLCTSEGELKANITAFVKWLEHVVELIESSEIELPERPDGSFSLDDNNIIEEAEANEDGDFTEDQQLEFSLVLDRISKLSDAVRIKVDQGDVGYIDFERLYNRGYFKRLKEEKVTFTEPVKGILSLFYEFAGRFSPANAARKESELRYDISPDHLFERAEKGEQLTALDVIRNFTTRLILENEDIARRVGDLDIEKMGMAEAGLFEEEEVKNENFFIYLVHNHKDEISSIDRVDGNLEVTLKTGFKWNSDEYIRGSDGWGDACDRNDCDMMGTEDVLFAIERSWMIYDPDPNSDENDYVAYFVGDFDLPTSSAWDDEYLSSTNDHNEPNITNPQVRSSNSRKVHTDGTQYGLLPPEGGTKMVMHSNETAKDPQHRYPMNYQRWEGGFAYPAASNSARPEFDNYAKAGLCEWDPKKSWAVHTYGPFEPHELDQYYYFILPLQRRDKQEDFGLYWWWSKTKDGAPNDWTQRLAGARLPLDAYAQWLKNSMPPSAKRRAEKAWGVTCYYRVKPPQEYFRVAFYQWSHNKKRPQGDYKPVNDLLAQGGNDDLDGRNWYQNRGPHIKKRMYPPYSVDPGPVNPLYGKQSYGGYSPGHAEGESPHGYWIPFIVTPALPGSSPWDEKLPEPVEFVGPVYWTDTQHKVAELANDHYQQPINLLGPPSNSGWYKITPVDSINDDLVKDQLTPQMSIHMSTDSPRDGQNPGDNSGYRGRYGAPITHLRTKPVVIFVDRNYSYSIAGWYPQEECKPPKNGRKEITQWGTRGEPWVKVQSLKLDKCKNGPCYWGTHTNFRSRPGLFDEHWQTPLHFYHETFNSYANPKTDDYVRPQAGKRYQLKGNNINTMELNPVTGKKEEYRTIEPVDVYFCLHPEAQNVDMNPQELINPRAKFAFAGKIDTNGKGKPITLSAPTRDMIFASLTPVDNKGTFRDIESWNPDGERVNVKCIEMPPGKGDHLEGPAFNGMNDTKTYAQTEGWTSLLTNGHVHFHSIYWNNPILSYNDTVKPGDENDKVVSGLDYDVVYTASANEKIGNPSAKLKDMRVRIIWGRKREAANPIWQNDPGFFDHGGDPATDKELYDFTDIVLTPGKKRTITAKSDLLYFGVFNVGPGRGPLGTQEDWSRFGQPLDISIKEKKSIRGCSLWASQRALNVTDPSKETTTWKELSLYKTPYIHLVKEISISRGYKDETNTIPGQYDGGTTPLVAGRRYKLEVTPFTPEGYQYRIRHIKDENALKSTNLNNSLVADDPNDNLDQTALSTVEDGNYIKNSVTFTAMSEFIMLEAWNTRDLSSSHPTDRYREDWSERGEPAYLKLSYDEPGVIEGRQYWTDVTNGSDTQKAASLKDIHWKDPLYYVTLNNRALKANTKYEIEIIDREDNPDYLHEIWIGPNPAAYRTGSSCNYVKGPQLRKGAKAEFKTTAKNVIPIIGCSDTKGRTLKSWNKDGEPIFYKFKELYKDEPEGPTYPASRMDSAPQDWNSSTTSEIRQYGEAQMFANPQLTIVDLDGDKNESGALPPNFTKFNVVGEAASDRSPAMVPGQRYRVKMSSLTTEKIPEDYEDELPYALRFWNVANLSDLDNTTFTPNKVTGERVFYPQYNKTQAGITFVPGNYMDFIPTSRNVIIGAARLGSRAPHEWSGKGEPHNVIIEKLPAQTSNGPSYPIDRANKDRPPAIENEYFLKPINYKVVRPNDKVQFEPDPNIPGNFERRLWWILDNPDLISENESKTDVNSPLEFDPLHPEDLFVYNRTTKRYGWKWQGRYLPGPMLTPGPDGKSEALTVPAGVTKAIISVFPEQGYTPPMPNRAGGYNELDAMLGMWGNNGEPLSGSFVTYEPPADTEGPVYWGDSRNISGSTRKKQEFLDSYWTTPLNHVRLIPNSEYIITKNRVEGVIPTWEDYRKIDIYLFNKDANNTTDANYTYLATFNENDDELLIETSGMCDIIFNAYDMKNNKQMSEWSVLGAPHPFTIKKRDKITGPVYWGDEVFSSGNPPDVWDTGFPNFNNPKWKGTKLESYSLEEGVTYELELKKPLEHGIHFWFCSSESAITISSTRKANWEQNEDLKPIHNKTGMKVGDTLTFTAMHRYMCFGCVNTDTGRTFTNWSSWGEPDPFKIKKVPFPQGPGYPAMEWNTSRTHTNTDLKHPRWNQLINLMGPTSFWGITNNDFIGFGDHFIPGVKYKFKYKGKKLDYHYDMWWVNAKMDGTTPKYTVKWDSTIRTTVTFKTKAAGYEIYFAMRSKTGNALPSPQTGAMSKWSPDGYPVKMKAKVDWKGYIPKNWWKWLAALLFLLAALIALYAYLRANAPMDVLLQMNEEHENNEYPIQRYKLQYDDEGKPYGYNYPNEMEELEGSPIYRSGLGAVPPDEGFTWCKDWDTKPKYFNYTADYLARAWARIMKLRHNGYLIHTVRNATPKREDLIQDDYTKFHVLSFANMTQTFGIGYSKLNTMGKYKFRKVFRHYEEWPADRNINRFNPYNTTGVKVIKVDSQTSQLKQNPAWNNKLEWFDADHYFVHFTKQDEIVESFGGAKYRSAETVSAKMKKHVFPTDGSMGQRAIFTPLGFGVKTDYEYSNFTSSHNIVWEIINGDAPMLDENQANNDNWNGVQDDKGFIIDPLLSQYYPSITFDMDVEGQVQLSMVHLNYEKRFFGDIVDRMAIKLKTDDPYKLRDTNDNLSVHSDYFQGNAKGLKLYSTTPIIPGIWRFVSISICFSIGQGSGNKQMIIKNLTNDFTYDTM